MFCKEKGSFSNDKESKDTDGMVSDSWSRAIIQISRLIEAKHKYGARAGHLQPDKFRSHSESMITMERLAGSWAACIYKKCR